MDEPNIEEEEEVIVDEKAWMQTEMPLEDLLNQTPRDLLGEQPLEDLENPVPWCPFFPVACEKANTWLCDKTCDRHADNYITDPAVVKEFEKTPHAIYCFTCAMFVESRRHENYLESIELIGSHITAVGITEYRTKLREWVVKRLGVHE